MLVNIVIAAMAHLPSLAHEPSRNLDSIRFEVRSRYTRELQLMRKYMRIAGANVQCQY